jgi:diamine N-acetyltransferase
MDGGFTFEILSKTRLPEIKPFWEKLNGMHRLESVYFKDFFEVFSFEKRISKFKETPDQRLRIEVARTLDGVCAGYCIATISPGQVGEIDSLFIEENYRGMGAGDALVRRGLEWMESRRCRRIVVGVACGHESVLPYYRRFGFYPRVLYLEKKGRGGQGE